MQEFNEMQEYEGFFRNEQKYVPLLDKAVIRKSRHKAEVRWYRRLVVLNIIIIIWICVWFFGEMKDNKEYAIEVKNLTVESFTSEDEERVDEVNQELDDKMEETPDSLTYFVIIFFLFLAMPFILYYSYAGYRSMSVRITKKNFPEIYDIVEEFAKKLDMKKVPPIYLVQGHGVLNAFASFVPFKQYIELYADLVEVGYREYEDLDSLRFIIAHEMAHIYLKHSTLAYNYSILFSSMVPILPEIASRAREYSCDRIAQKLSGSDGIDAMMSLTAGIHLYKRVDKEDFIEHAKTVNGFFVWCYNLVSSHPVMSKRIIALEMKEGSGKLY